MRSTCSITSIMVFVCLGLLLAAFIVQPEGRLLFAQAVKQETKKETQEQKKDRPQFDDQDDQSAVCQSAMQRAKLVASILETYSRRLSLCATSLNFHDDCSTHFALLRKA